jgi:nucleoid-associated protein YgaU
MTRETKIGLLVGMGVIILIGILISDHLSVAQRQQQAHLSAGIPEIDQDMVPPPAVDRTIGQQARRVDPLPLPQELTQQAQPQNPGPVVLKQDLYPAIIPGSPTTQPAVVSADPRPTTQDRTLVPASPHAGEFVVVTGPGSAQPPVVAAITPEQLKPAPVPAEPKQVVHFVGKSETLSDISRKYFGTPGQWKLIYEANKDKMSSPDQLRPGVRLIIPAAPSAPAAAGTTAIGSASPSPEGSTLRVVAERPAGSDKPADKAADKNDKPANKFQDYSVKSGDTLSSLAARFYGSPGKWKDLYQLNKSRIKDPDRLSEGTVLRVPVK